MASSVLSPQAERVPLIDALRGFALWGVFTSNVVLFLSGRMLMPRAQVEAAMRSGPWLDVGVQYLFSILVFGKFLTLFAFLFGLGFAVQMGRAEARGVSIVPLYARRLAVLLGIGLLHLVCLWYGDILGLYAVLGFGLLLFRGRADRTVLLWAAGLVLVTPVLGMLVMQLPRFLASTPEAAAAMTRAATERGEALKAATREAFSQGGVVDLWMGNLRFYAGDIGRMTAAAALAVLGRFLLGFLAGRRQVLHDVLGNVRLYRRLLGWGLAVGVLASAVLLLVQRLRLGGVLRLEEMPWLPVTLVVVRQLAELGLAAVYLSAFALLFQRAGWRRVLGVLAPAGRMALTNYLAQSVIGIGLFYGLGLGLMGKVGPAACMGIVLVCFGVQVALSHLWLSRFQFGPVEWVWRSLTYGRLQPMERRVQSMTVTP